MALRHFCPNAVSARCIGTEPGRGPKRCPGCGAAPYVEEGAYGVFRFDDTGRSYTFGFNLPASKPRYFHRRSAADAYADALNTPNPGIDMPPRGYVVRFIRERLL